MHDFKDQGHGKAIPYGIFDLASEEGWVQVGIDHDTAQFAVNSLRGWWEHLGRERYPDARTLTVTADCPVEGRVAALGRRDRAGDPGLSRPAGHQQVEQDRASAVLLHHQQRARQTAHLAGDDRQPDRLHDHPQRPEGLSRRDEGSSPAKVTVSDAELEAVALQGDGFHPEWNYTREPRVLTWHRLTLYAEGAVSARACGAVATGCFARLLSYEVDWTPRSEVLG